ncbi:MAG: hypothetical protein GF368_00495 [Candidatus Aenigmarchaeota archaeon]|nr:hypothetical protein [Candidatus Aenigmarchaeota archaeon]
MKGVAQGIPSYLYVLAAIVVGIIMLVILSRYSKVLFGEKAELRLTGDEQEISKRLSEIIQKCWVDNRRGLEDESSIYKEISLTDSLKIEEKNLTDHLDCEKLPNNDCYIYPDGSDPDYDCSLCDSPYFDDGDKIIWLAEEDNTELKISYHGGSRKIVVVGYPCDDRCMCERDCKKKCIDGLSTTECEDCYNDCGTIVVITTTITTPITTTTNIITTTSTSTTIPTPQWSQCFSPADYLDFLTCNDLCASIGKVCVNACIVNTDKGPVTTGLKGYGYEDHNCGSSSLIIEWEIVKDYSCSWPECVWPGHRNSCKCCCR